MISRNESMDLVEAFILWTLDLQIHRNNETSATSCVYKLMRQDEAHSCHFSGSSLAYLNECKCSMWIKFAKYISCGLWLCLVYDCFIPTTTTSLLASFHVSFQKSRQTTKSLLHFHCTKQKHHRNKLKTEIFMLIFNFFCCSAVPVLGRMVHIPDPYSLCLKYSALLVFFRIGFFISFLSTLFKPFFYPCSDKIQWFYFDGYLCNHL